MTAILLSLSLLLNIIAIFSIILLFLRQNKLLEAEKKQEKMFNEMEEVISSYLIQVKEENDDFISRISMLKVNESASINEAEEKKEVNVKERKLSGKNVQIANASAYHAVKAYQKNYQPVIQPAEEIEPPKPELHNEEDIGIHASQRMPHNEPSFIERVLLLKQQGLTEDEIAKTLGKGRTEIALMLKFHHNQQE
ncbi:DUF6115 domain-containing protein [Cytobacillus sp. NCCP-133]|uniref:DUF6115 domain-containing protein n=1 Tax=Cytobacillus sp. NCCP-133 TaxID=766848 RepID=UPI00222F33EB|nr:hypothetical protein [Cytobacillus sp. NCCP-133]GLB59320.1 hypothetical protein NCCP133_14530 [Cytobacillus sp. NCCP-133]